MAELPENDRIAGPFIAYEGQTDFPADFPLINLAGLRLRYERVGGGGIEGAPEVLAVDETPAGFICRRALPMKAGDRVWVYSELPPARLRRHTPNGAIRSATLEGDAEELQAQLQEVRRELDRGLVPPVGEPGLNLPEAAIRAGRFLTFGVDGQLRLVERPEDFDGLNKLNRDGSNLEDPAGFVETIGATSAESTQFIPGLVYNSRAAAVLNGVIITAWIASGRRFGALTGGQKLYLTAFPGNDAAVFIRGRDKFVLRTNGTTLVYAWSSLNDLRKMFEVSDCGAIDFGDARIAYDPPCHVQGTVTAVAAGAVDFIADAGFAPVISDVAVSITYDPATQTYTRTGGGYDNDLGSVARTGSDTVPPVGLTYDFTNTLNGWVTSNGTLAASSGGALFVSGSAGQLIRHNLAIIGAAYSRVVVSLTRTKARTSGAWSGTAYYFTAGHSYNSSFRKIISTDPAVGERVDLVWDMASLSSGGADWLNNIITTLRLDLDQGPGGEFIIHKIAFEGALGANATRVYRYSPPSEVAGGYKIQPFAVGDRIILLPRKYWFMGVDLYNVADLRGHLIFESSTGFCVAANNIGNIGLTYETNPPPGQIMVSPGDGLHLTDIQGGRIFARGEYLGDDVLNVHSRSWSITTAAAWSYTINASFGDSANRYPKPARPKINDLVYIYNADGVIVQSAKVISISGPTSASVIVLDAVLNPGWTTGWKIQTAVSAGLNPLSIQVFGRTIHARTALVRRRNVNGSVTSAKTLAQSFIAENVMDAIPEGPVPGEIDIDLVCRESWTRLDAQSLPGAAGLYAISITGKAGGATDVTEIRIGRLSMDNHPFGGIGVESAQVEIGMMQIGTGMGSRRASLPGGMADAGSRYEANASDGSTVLIGSVMSGEGGRVLRQRAGNLIAAGSMLNASVNAA